MFKGTATALITPFTKDGVDYNALENLLEFQIQNGIDALLICGTTGEPATMTSSERKSVIEFSIKKINHRVPVIVGTGSNCTRTAIENTLEAEKLGADAALVVTPYYNKCTQNGLYEHYKAIATSTNLPIILYNVPSRTGVNILPETVKRLTEFKNIVGIKEACGNLEQIKATAEGIKGTQLELYSGDDSLALDIMKLGGSGLISVASNFLPKDLHNMIIAAWDNNYTKAQSIFDTYKEIFKVMFVEVNPIPVKYACYRLGLCSNEIRLPLTPLSIDGQKAVDHILKKLNLI